MDRSPRASCPYMSHWRTIRDSSTTRMMSLPWHVRVHQTRIPSNPVFKCMPPPYVSWIAILLSHYFFFSFNWCTKYYAVLLKRQLCQRLKVLLWFAERGEDAGEGDRFFDPRSVNQKLEYPKKKSIYIFRLTSAQIVTRPRRLRIFVDSRSIVSRATLRSSFLFALASAQNLRKNTLDLNSDR